MSCPNLTLVTHPSEPMRAANYALFAISSIYVLVTLAAFRIFQRSYLGIAKRSFVNLCVVSLGVAIELILNFLQIAVGDANFPCDLLLWLNVFVVPFCVGGLVLRTVLFHYDVVKYQATSRPRVDSTYLAALDAHVVDVKFRVNRIWVGFGALVGLSVVAAVVIEATQFSYYGKGCSGCQNLQGVVEYSIPIVQAIVLVWTGLYYSHRNRDVPDPLHIRHDTRNAIIFVFLVALVGFVLFSADPGNVQRDSRFSWTFIIAAGFLGMYTILCPAAMIRAYREFHYVRLDDAKLRDRDAFKRALLNDMEFSESFRVYCAEELSVENYMFFFAVRKYVKSADKAKEAKEIVDAYVAPNAPWEINVSSETRKSIMGKMKTAAGFTDETFNEAVDEVMDLLHNDTYPRYVRKMKERRATAGVKRVGPESPRMPSKTLAGPMGSLVSMTASEDGIT